MSESSTKIYLIAGATRGLGLALVDVIATRDPSAIIYAGARDPENGASYLVQVAAQYPGRVEIVKYVAGDKEGNDAIAKEIGIKHGRVDTVIANAGAIPLYLLFVNAVGPIVLFQSVRDLLKASPLPRFVPISSTRGSVEYVATATFNIPYGMSKAALNWVTRKIHYENDWLVAYPQCPGAVDTDMAVFADKTGAIAELLKGILRTPNVAAGMVLDILWASTREKDGGQFHSIKDGRIPW
ncbi:hypothetical protein BJ912DRAFT_1106266, partial [Pholiota molesta]